MHRLLLSLAVIALTSTGAFAQVVVGGPQTSQTVDARFTTSVDVSSASKIKKAQEAAGDLTFRDATYTVDGPGTGSPRTVTLVARKLTLQRSSIRTNGNNLVLVVHELRSDDRSVIFSGGASDDDSADSDETSDGRPGRHAGKIEVHITGGISGPVQLDLRGEDGEYGADGVAGRRGSTGAQGRHARDRGPFCRRKAGKGRPGGRGGEGGRGGNGGPGGNGGELRVFFHGIDVELGALTHDRNGGEGGKPGKGGPGGPGGRGGPQGPNTANCSSTRGGGRGGTGKPGRMGAPGTPGSKGAEGTFEARRLDVP